MSKARRSPKQNVLDKFPEAKECYTRSGEKAIGLGLNTILGLGRTWREAWADAAKVAKCRSRL